MPAATPTSHSLEVLVLGGGLIGLCTALSLADAGHSVTVVEREELGSGAARGNAGEITPLTALPLAGPGMLRETVRGVLSNKHYLSIGLTALPGLAAFGMAFLSRCGPRSLAAGTRSLDQLVRGAFASFDRLERAGVSVGGGGRGFLYTHADVAALEAAHAAMSERADLLGMQRPDPVVTGAELRELEPALRADVPAAFVASTERYLDPNVFVDSLAAALWTRGVRILEGTEVTRLGLGDAKPTASVRSLRGPERLSADRVVLACGAWTSALLGRSGAKTPRGLAVKPGRGYSFTVDVDTMPRWLAGSLQQKTVAIPMSGQLRVVGLMDFDGSTDTFNQRRVEHLAWRVQQFLRGIDVSSARDLWVGPRPMTASGLPIISPLPADNRFIVAAGHNMHGLSLGPVTGDIVTALVEGRMPNVEGRPIDPAPFTLPGALLNAPLN